MTIEFDPGPDYKGRLFDRFFVAREPSQGPGWYIFGRCTSNDIVIKLCARPDVRPRRHPHYNIRVRRGWLRKMDAVAALQEIPQ